MNAITKYLPGWPEGSPGELRSAADTWRTVASGLESAVNDTGQKASLLTASWEGSAKDAFGREWTKFANSIHDGCGSLRDIASALDQMADKLEDAQHKYEVAAGAAVATAAVGIGLTLFTFGASDAVAAEATAGEVGAAVAVAEEATSVVGGLLDAAVNIAMQMAQRFMVAFATDVVAQGAIGSAVYSDHNPLSHIDLQSALTVAGGAAIPDLPGGALTQVGWGALLGGGETALSEELTTGHIDGGQVLLGAGEGAAGAGLGVGLGKAFGAFRNPEEIANPTAEASVEADPVDVATGDVILTQTDLTLPAVLPLTLERTHRSSWRVGGWFGRSWLSSFDQRLEVGRTGVCALFADGRALTWPRPEEEDSPVLSVSGALWQLRRSPDGDYTVTDPQRGLTWRFAAHDAHPTSPDGRGVFPLAEIAHRAGQSIAFSYADDGSPSGVRHSGGYDVRVAAHEGHVTGLTLAAPGGGIAVTEYEYDERGNLAGIVNSSGQPLRFSYDGAGRLAGWEDRNGYFYRYAYDEQGRCVQGEGPGGTLSGTFAYDPEARVTRWTDVAGAVTTYEMTRGNRVAATTDPLGNVTRQSYDERGRVTAVTDPLGRITRYGYDGFGNVTAVTRPDGRRVHAEFDDAGLPVGVTEADGATWRQEYDDRGNRVALTAPDGGVTRYGYDDNGRLECITDAAGAVTRIEVNAAGLPAAVTGPEGGRTRYERNAFGLIREITGPDGAVTGLSWTAEGRLEARSLPGGAEENWAYDAEGNLTSYRNAAGDTTTYEYGPFDRLAAMTGPDGTRTEFGNDHQLNVTEVTHGGLAWRYAYDAAGRLAAETDYNGAATRYGYDAAGQLTERVNAAGQGIAYAYDVLGNVVEQRSGEAVTSFGYDAAGRLAAARNADAEVVLTRDALGRVTGETCDGRTVSTSYDAAGRVTGRVTPSGAATSWDYDAAGLPSVMRFGGRELRFGFDAAGRERRRELPGGVALAQDWDVAGRLSAQVLTGPGLPDPLQRRSYAYNPDGFVTGIGDLLSGDRSFGLDAAGRVIAVTGTGWSERYAYDAAGNIASAALPAKPWGESDPAEGREITGTLIRRAGTIRYRYDAAGRVTVRMRTRISRKPETWRYEWDADNRLTSVTAPDKTVWRYRYDPLGRRVAKEHRDTSGRVLTATRFTWDGPTLSEQSERISGDSGIHEATRESVTTWDYQPGTFTPLAQVTRVALRDAPQEEIDERFHAIVTDLVGAPAELVAPDGTLAGHQVRTLWGSTVWDSSGEATPLRFPGQYADEETGLHYNNQRYYDPASGTYLSPDPLGLAPSPNPHAYVPNPHAEIDPLGLMACEGTSGQTPDTRNGVLAGGTHPVSGVPFDENGYPDFSQWRHPDVPDVTIEPSGTRSGDFARANDKAGLDRTPEGYTWHHHQDYGRMQLIQKAIHAQTGHTGGFSIWGRP